MSSRYSVDSTNIFFNGHVASMKPSGEYLRRTTTWLDQDHAEWGMSSTSISSSPRDSKTEVELDLDSLFKRLDKYTAEMEEVEARLKRRRSDSDESFHINITRFSFENHNVFVEDHPLNEPTATWELPVSPSTNYGTTDPPVEAGVPHSQDRAIAQEDESDDIDEPLIIQSNAIPQAERLSLPVVVAKAEAPRHTESVQSVKSVNAFCIPIQNPNDEDENASHQAEGCTRAGRPRRISAEKPLASRDLQDQTDSSMVPGQSHARRCSEELNRAQNSRLTDTEYSDVDEPGPAVPTTWRPPPRTSSKTCPTDDVRAQPKETSPKLDQETEMLENRQSVRYGGFWSAPGLMELDQEPVPPLPNLSQSGSIATIASSPPPTPLSLCSPREDQIRRELESFALHEGADTLELKYKKRRPPRLDLVDADGEDHGPDEPKDPQLDSEGKDRGIMDLNRPRPRRSKSIMSIFHRRSPVEKVIDLYFDDEPEEKSARPLTRWVTMSRKGSPTTANMPKSPQVPPLPTSNPGPKQTSFGRSSVSS